MSKPETVSVEKKELLAIRAQWVDVVGELEDIPETIKYLKKCAMAEIVRIDKILREGRRT